MDPRRHCAQHRHYRPPGDSRGYQQAPIITYGSPRRSSSSQQDGTGRRSPQHRSSQPNISLYTSSSQGHTTPRQDTEYYYWHMVPRPWETENPQVRRSTADERLLSGLSASPQTRGHNHHQRPERDPYERINGTNQPTGRFTLAQLQRLGDERTPTNNITLWREECPRDSAWNGIGYVRAERENRRRNGPS